MNLKTYVENHGKKIITIFKLIDLKKEIKENIVFVMKAKNIYRSNTSDETFLSVIQKCNLFSNLLNVIFNYRWRRLRKFKRVGLVTRSSKSSKITR